MPDWSGDATTLRSRQFSRVWLAVFSGSVVYTADIDAVDNANTISTLTISGGSGTFADVKRGAEVVIYNSSGEYKGNVRVRRAGTLSVTSLPISETAKGFVQIIAGDTLAVLDDHRLRPVFPQATSTFDPDKETYTNQTEQYPPVAHSGGHRAKNVDVGQSYATFDFYGSSSYTLDDDSSGTVTHLWTFPSGSTPTSSTSADPTGVQIPVGEHRIIHTVTDSSNSKTWTQYIHCGVYNSASPAYEVETGTISLSGSEDSGWELSFELAESAGIDTLPDGAWVILFAEDYYDGTLQSFGNLNADCSNQKFTGILRTDTSNSDANDKRITYTAVSPIQVLREMAGFSQLLEDTATAIEWQDLEDMSSQKVLIHLLRTYTTATDMLDLYYQAVDYRYPILNFQKATPYEQFAEIIEGIDSRFTSDRTCNLMIQKRQEMYTLATRSGLTTTFTIDGATNDFTTLSLERPHIETLRLLEGRAFIPAGSSLGDVYSRFPSLTPGENAQDSTIDWMIASSQSDLNTRTGLRGGKLNKVYIQSDGYKQFAPKLTIETRLDIFDFYQEWVAFSLDATSNWREVDISGFRWIVRQINVTIDENGAYIVQLTLDAETAAPKGQTYFPPQIDPLQLPDIEFPPLDIIPPFIGPFPIITFGSLGGDAAIVREDGHIEVTSNFFDATPTWNDYDHSATITETIIDYTTDASTAFFTTGTGAVGAFVITASFIYHIDDIFSATPTISNVHTWSTSASNGMIDADFIYNVGTHVAASRALLNNKIIVAYSTNGTSFTEVDVVADGTNTAGLSPALHYSTASAGTIYCYASTDTNTDGFSDTGILYVSTNSGSSWTAVDPLFNDLLDVSNLNGRILYFPFRKSGNTWFYFVGDGGSTSGQVWVGNTSTLQSARVEVVGSNGNDYTFVSGAKFRVQCCYATDKIFFALRDAATGQFAMWQTTDFNTLTPSIVPLPDSEGFGISAFDVSPEGDKIVGWSTNTVYYWTEEEPTMTIKRTGLGSFSPVYVFVK